MSRSYLKAGASELESKIAEANTRYWRGKPTGLSDGEFEALLTRLRTLRPSSPCLSTIGPRGLSGNAVTHANPMLSLRKVHDVSGIDKWAKSAKATIISITPKVDGVACSLVYGSDGNLLYAATRGDGEVGELITDAVVATAAVPTKVEGPGEVRGELYVSKHDFRKMTDVVCARNVAAGYVKRNKPDETFPLQFYAYDVLGLENEDKKRQFLANAEFDSPWYRPYRSGGGPKQLALLIAEIETLRESWPYEADGLVFRTHTQKKFDALGATAHHPRGAVAYKFPDDSVETTITGFTWDVSRTGAITPVANFSPVRLAGAEISSATLHHVGRFRSLGIKEGSKVTISRRGGVIPHIDKVTSSPKGDPIEPPGLCPACLSPTTEVKGDSQGASTLVCTNSRDCPGVGKARVIYYAATVGIKGLGPAIAENLFLSAAVRSLPDIYRLQFHVPTKTEKNLIDQIESHKKLPFSRFLAGLGIDLIGAVTAKKLAQSFDSATLFCLATAADIAEVVGEHAASKFGLYMADNEKEVAALLDEVEIIEAASTSKGGKYLDSPLVGATILFTGALDMPRSAAVKAALSCGAEELTSVTAKLDFLVAKDAEGNSTKLKKARTLINKGSSLRIINEEQFQEMLTC